MCAKILTRSQSLHIPHNRRHSPQKEDSRHKVEIHPHIPHKEDIHHICKKENKRKQKKTAEIGKKLGDKSKINEAR